MFNYQKSNLMATIQDARARVEMLLELIDQQNEQIKTNALIIESLKDKLGL